MRATMQHPELLLLDEPTAGLDPRSAYDVRQIIAHRKRRSTLVISSHNLHELEQLCDHAAILDHGKVISAGSMANLTAASEEVRIQLAPGPTPLDELRKLSTISGLEWDSETREVVLRFATGVEGEAVIGDALRVLVENGAKVSGVKKGQGLERRVVDLTR